MLHDVKSYKVTSYDSNQLDTHFKLEYDGTIVCVPLIDYNTLIKKLGSLEKELKEERKKRELLEKDLKDWMASAELCTDLVQYTTLTWYEDNKGAKKGCGRLADAMILANAVRGMSLSDIQEQAYPYKKDGRTKKYDRRKIFSALSVKKPTDYARITELLGDFPEVFKDIDREEVYAWMQKKANKGGN